MQRNISDICHMTEKYKKWYSCDCKGGSVFVCGGGYYKQQYYCDELFARMIANEISDTNWEAGLCSFFKEINGNWALIILKNNILYAAVDRVRSFPLLYSEKEGSFLLSDADTVFLRHKHQWCVESVEDFLWSGYPPGESTLLPDVSQIPSGSFLRYSLDRGEKVTKNYFTYMPDHSSHISEEQLSETLVNFVYDSVRRSARLVKGRIIVPLSGGLDSRMIVAALKKEGFENVVCFTYGVRNNSESLASRQVANTLGYEWHFVEYSPDVWKQWMFSKAMQDYFYFACNSCSMPTYASWYAVKTLCEKGLVTAGDVFMPGHAADFLLGSHIPEEYFTIKTCSLEEVQLLNINKHFFLWPKLKMRPPGIAPRLQKDSLFCKASNAFLQSDDASSLLDAWNWKERQSKMIVNNGRLYEYFGHEWQTPLWDNELTDFALSIPFGLRCGRRLNYRAAVEHMFVGTFSSLGDIPLADGLSPREKMHKPEVPHSKGKCREFGRRCINKLFYRNRNLYFRNHALALCNGFALGNNPLHISINEVFAKHDLESVFDWPAVASVSSFTHRPVGTIHPFAISSLYTLALLYRRNRELRS